VELVKGRTKVVERMNEQGFELIEEACHEGERDVTHILRGNDPR
jgi:hypothetical protein